VVVIAKSRRVHFTKKLSDPGEAATICTPSAPSAPLCRPVRRLRAAHSIAVPLSTRIPRSTHTDGSAVCSKTCAAASLSPEPQTGLCYCAPTAAKSTPWRREGSRKPDRRRGKSERNGGLKVKQKATLHAKKHHGALHDTASPRMVCRKDPRRPEAR
jgi:hypothetical protein